jgi:glycosyltransferase involved in cell wall biosynthesis
MPSYGTGGQKEKIGIVGGLGVVTDEILKRISDEVDITGIGMATLRGQALPTDEDIDGYHVIRPAFTLPPSQVVERFSELFKRAGIEFTGAHIKELPLIRYINDYTVAISEVEIEPPPDLICSHDWMAFPGGYEKSRTNKIPLIVFIHSLEPGRAGGMVHTPSGPTEARPLGRYAGSQTIRDIEALGLKESDVCFTVGTTMVKEVKLMGKRHGIPVASIKDKVFPIHHGVDTKIFRPIRDVEKAYDLLFIGRFAAVKGILELLDAVKIVKPLLPNIKVRLLGGGELEPDIRKKIKENYLEENVSISTEWFQQEGKVLEINKSRVTIAPSKYEPHGQFDLESGACAIPCITGTGGFAERVIPEITALPCNPFDARDMAEKIYSLLKDEQKTEEIGKNARDFIAQNYRWDVRAKVYPEIFEIVATGKIKKLKELPLTVDLQSTGFL